MRNHADCIPNRGHNGKYELFVLGVDGNQMRLTFGMAGGLGLRKGQIVVEDLVAGSFEGQLTLGEQRDYRQCSVNGKNVYLSTAVGRVWHIGDLLRHLADRAESLRALGQDPSVSFCIHVDAVPIVPAVLVGHPQSPVTVADVAAVRPSESLGLLQVAQPDPLLGLHLFCRHQLLRVTDDGSSEKFKTAHLECPSRRQRAGPRCSCCRSTSPAPCRAS